MVSLCTTAILTITQVIIASSGINKRVMCVSVVKQSANAAFVVGVALVVLGSLNLDNCPVEESLPVWMIAAGKGQILFCISINQQSTLLGSTLLLLTILCLLYALCSCCRPSSSSSSSKRQRGRHREGFGATLCALGCAFVAGGLAVVFLLVWLALWVAGTYFVAVAVDRIRVEQLAPHQVPDPDEVRTLKLIMRAMKRFGWHWQRHCRIYLANK